VSMQQSSEATEVCVLPDSPILSMIWALEDCDHMQLSGDLFDLPEFQATLIPKTFKRRSLTSLRQERARSKARHQEQTSGKVHVSNKLDAGRKRLGFQCARTSSMKAELTLPVMPEVHEAKGAQPAKLGCSASLQESNTISATFLAGAVALGLRRQCTRAANEPHVQQQACFNLLAPTRGHLTNNDVKEKVCTDETSTMERSEQKLKEAMLLPRAPCKPPSETHRTRPQIRGVPILVIPKTYRLKTCKVDQQQ